MTSSFFNENKSTTVPIIFLRRMMVISNHCFLYRIKFHRDSNILPFRSLRCYIRGKANILCAETENNSHDRLNDHIIYPNISL